MNNVANPQISTAITQVFQKGIDVIEQFSIWEEDLSCTANSLKARSLMSDDGQSCCEPALLQACERYFQLLMQTTADLKGTFTEEEFSILLNAECTPAWRFDAHSSLASLVADSYGIESLDEAEGAMHTLLVKLLELSLVEKMTVVDVCEQVWRGRPNPLLD